jgi:hypothetical protein
MLQELLDGAMRLGLEPTLTPPSTGRPGPLDLVGIYDGDCQLHHKDSMRELYASRDEWHIQISPTLVASMQPAACTT